jgi:hypothetical protein
MNAIDRNQPAKIHTSHAATERAMRRLMAELRDGLRHGFFEFTIRCETVSQGRRRLELRAGKSYQFVIPAEECESADDPPNEGVRIERS